MSVSAIRDVRLAAVIVTYNPSPDFRLRLQALLEHVANAWIVDNGSELGSRAQLDDAPSSVTVIANERNLGIAAAQNAGMKLAHERGYRWVILLDQDTSLTHEYFAVARAALMAVDLDDTVALFAPRYEDRGSGLHGPSANGRETGTALFTPIDSAISSGSLVRVSSFVAVGGMDSRLFIDYVDFDFLIRLKMARYQALALPATIQHSVGNASKHGLLRWTVTTSNHPAPRLFSAGRNLTILTRRYRKTQRKLLLNCWRAELKRLLKITMFETQSVRKIVAFASGVMDGLIHGDTCDVADSKYYRKS
jgi:rhamnosyltransferase